MSHPASNNLPWADQVARIRGLAETFEPEDIASTLRISIGDVNRALADIPRGKWWVRCNKTGSTRIVYGKRGAYRLVQMLGWTDWDWGTGEPGQGVQP